MPLTAHTQWLATKMAWQLAPSHTTELCDFPTPQPLDCCSFIKSIPHGLQRPRGHRVAGTWPLQQFAEGSGRHTRGQETTLGNSSHLFPFEASEGHTGCRQQGTEAHPSLPTACSSSSHQALVCIAAGHLCHVLSPLLRGGKEPRQRAVRGA